MKLKQGLIVIGTLWPIVAFSAGGDSFSNGNRLFSYCKDDGSNPAPATLRG